MPHIILNVGRAMEKGLVLIYSGTAILKGNITSVKKLNVLHDRAIPRLRIYPKKITDVNNELKHCFNKR